MRRQNEMRALINVYSLFLFCLSTKDRWWCWKTCNSMFNWVLKVMKKLKRIEIKINKHENITSIEILITFWTFFELWTKFKIFLDFKSSTICTFFTFSSASYGQWHSIICSFFLFFFCFIYATSSSTFRNS